MDRLLEADNLIAPFNLVEALKYKFTMHYHVVCSWAALAKAVDDFNPQATFEGRPSIMTNDEK